MCRCVHECAGAPSDGPAPGGAHVACCVVLWPMPHSSLGSPASLQSPSSPKSHDGDRRSRGADSTENTDLDEGFHPDMTVEERQL